MNKYPMDKDACLPGKVLTGDLPIGQQVCLSTLRDLNERGDLEAGVG